MSYREICRSQIRSHKSSRALTTEYSVQLDERAVEFSPIFNDPGTVYHLAKKPFALNLIFMCVLDFRSISRRFNLLGKYRPLLENVANGFIFW